MMDNASPQISMKNARMMDLIVAQIQMGLEMANATLKTISRCATLMVGTVALLTKLEMVFVILSISIGCAEMMKVTVLATTI